MLSLAACVIRNGDNSVDHESSGAAFAEALVKYEADEIALVESQKGTYEAICTAVNEVFDANLGEAIPSPAVISFTLAKLPAGMYSVKNHKELSAMVLNFLQASSQDGGPLQTRKGPNGGISRLCDAKPETK
jgi:hypothetical protein